MTDTEHAHQVTFVNWFRESFPDCMIAAVPNGELRAISVAQRLKAEGVVSGIPDLFCLFPKGVIFWIEMKKKKGGRVSKEQKEIHKKMQDLGQKVTICNGYEEAIEKIKEFAKDLDIIKK